VNIKYEEHHCIIQMLTSLFCFSCLIQWQDLFHLLWRVASVFFTSDCIGELEGPFASAFETDLDFVFGLRLLTPLRPMMFSLF
jgi:hypothetical protein